MTFARAISTADRLIGKYGASVTLYSVSDGQWDSARGTSSVTVTTATGKAVRFPDVSREISGSQNTDPLIPMKDSQILMGPLTAAGGAMTAPRIGDQYQFHGTDYAVLSVDSLNPNGEQILWTVRNVQMAIAYPRRVSILRLPLRTGVGALPYGGHVQADESAVFQGLPAGVQLRRASGRPEPDLPADALNRTLWRISIPRRALPIGAIQVRDIVVDDMGDRWHVTAAQFSLIGYDLMAERLDT